MRTLQTLTVACLLFYGVKVESVQGKSGLRQHLEHAKTCSLECVEREGSLSTSKNWVIRLDVNNYILYSADNNYIAIYNVNLSIAVVYDSVSSILIVVNVKTGDSLLIRLQIALFVKGSGVVTDFNNETGVYDGINWCYRIIIKYKARLIANTSTMTGGYFSVTILLEYLLDLKGEIDLTTVVNGRTDLAVQLNDAFGIYFQSVATSLKRGDVSITAGGFVLVGVVFDLSKNLYIYQFFYVLYVKQIVITVEIIDIFYTSITTNNSSKITSIAILLYNVGVLYETTDSAMLAFKAGYFTYLQVTVNINGEITPIIFSRDSNTQNWNICMRNSRYCIFIIYYRNINSLIFVNSNYNLLIVFPSKGSVFTVYNGATGIAIAVSKIFARAKVIESNTVAISKAYLAGNLKLSISLMVTATTQTTISPSEEEFMFSDWLDNIYRFGPGYTYKLNATTKAKIDANFNALIVNFKAINGYNLLYGSFNVLLITFKGFQPCSLATQFVLLVYGICVKSALMFNSSILTRVYYEIQNGISPKSPGIVSNLFSNSTVGGCIICG